jgi:4-hydroxybenzoate polyprenyltransferase
MSRPGLTRERLLALFLLGLLLFLSPFLGIFNTPDRLLGLPSLYLYMFASWMLLIALVAVVIESSDDDERDTTTARTSVGASEAMRDRTRS